MAYTQIALLLMMAVRKLDRPINQYTSDELKIMHANGVIDYCPICKRYHQKSDKPDWPLGNMWRCDDCTLKQSKK